MSRLDLFARNKFVLLSVLFAWTCLACGLEQDITFDEPDEAPPEGNSVRVLWGENEEVVFLNDLDRIVFEDNLVCRLWDILLAAGLEEEEILSMRFDFESTDGFSPSSRDCEPLEGEILRDGGYLDPENMNLMWDSSLGLRGCYSVTDLARILGEASES